jgi:hypothetical protein
MTRYSEPNNRQIEEARALLFLAETRKALRSEHLSGLTLELEAESNIHNQRVYRVHATREGIRITAREGREVHPVTGTPFNTARFIAADAHTAAKAAKGTAASQTRAA